MNQNTKTHNSYLTGLAQAAYADEADSIGSLIFPPVEVKTPVGSYKNRSINDAFRVYDTKLTRGNSAKRIDVNTEEDYFNCRPNALEIGHWEFDMEQEDGDDEREAGLQELMSVTLVSREAEAISIFKKGIPAQKDSGKWINNPTANIIGELDTAMLQIYNAIAKQPTHLVMGLSAWNIIKNHPAILERFHGIASNVTLEGFRELLLLPNIEIRLAPMLQTPAARGKKGEKTPMLGNDIFIFYTQDAPTRDDMSVAKDFTLDASGPSVRSYEDEKLEEVVDKLRWSSDRHITCAAAGARIEITEA